MLNVASEMFSGVDIDKRAGHVALLAFRCARHVDEMRDLACAQALKAYLDVNPNNENASDDVVAVLVDALRARPHWVN